MKRYEYTIDADETFPNRRVDLPRFTEEIRASAITTALEGELLIVAGNCCVDFKAELSAEDALILGALVSAHSGAPLPVPTQSVHVTNAQLTVNAMPPEGMKSNQISQNWCDKTTWWYSAQPAVNEVATTMDPARKVWALSAFPVIDVYHGKLTGEESLPQYRVKVVLGGVTLAERDPHFGTGGDFTVDYVAGSIELMQPAPAGVDPVVSFYYANGSTWIIRPAEGETWKLKGAESQFSDDVVMNDSMIYEVWAYDPNNYPNKMMVAAPDYYKSIYDFVNDANKAYAEIPAIGGAGWRGAKCKTAVFAWDFQTTTEFKSSWGMELRVRLEHDTEYGGTFATGTFYFIRESE